MPEKIDFKSWWDKKYFYTTGHYALLFKTYISTAQSRSRSAFCNCLRYGDIVLLQVAFSTAAPKKKTQAPLKYVPPVQEMKLGEALSLEAEVESLKNAMDQAIDDLFVCAQKWVQEMRQCFKKTRSIQQWRKFHLPQMFQFCFSRGKKSDIWGSFFLLAVTEHMKSTRGKPHYRLVDNLLRAVHRLPQVKISSLVNVKNSSISSDGRCRAAGKINKLKETHPDWAAVLAPINRQLDMNKNESRTGCARWDTSGPKRHHSGFGTLKA